MFGEGAEEGGLRSRSSTTQQERIRAARWGARVCSLSFRGRLPWAVESPGYGVRGSALQPVDLLLQLSETPIDRERVAEQEQPGHGEGDEDVPVSLHRARLWRLLQQ